MKFIENNRDNRINVQNKDFMMPDILTPLSSKEAKLYAEYSNDEANLEILNMSYRIYHNNPNADTAYKVEHYQQNANDNNYTLKDTENKKEQN